MAATHESLALLAAVRGLDINCGEVSDVEVEELRAALRDAKDSLANPLCYPAKKLEDRAVVKRGTVTVRGREVRLGALDIDNALMLSETFDLNEIVAVELLVASVERGSPPEDCLTHAAGMFLRERQHLLESLCRLLRAVSTPEEWAPVDQHAKQAVDSFVAEILRGGQGQGQGQGSGYGLNNPETQTLVGRLVEVLASPFPGQVTAQQARVSPLAYVVQTPGGAMGTPGGTSLVPVAGAPVEGDPDPAQCAAALEFVTDERGRPCLKQDWLAHERKLLAEALFHAVQCGWRVGGDDDETKTKIVSPTDATNLVKLLADVAAPALAVAAADVRARAAALESGSSNGGANATGAAHVTALGARVGAADALGELAVAAADELPAAIAILFAVATAMTPDETGDDSDTSKSNTAKKAIATNAAAVLEQAIKHAEDKHRRARDGDDADAAVAAAARNPLRSAALGGGFGGLMFRGNQERSASDDAATEIAGMTVSVLEFCRLCKGLAVLGTGDGDDERNQSAKQEIVAASDAGALTALRCVLSTGTFRDDADTNRLVYLNTAHRALRCAMAAALRDPDLGEALAAVAPAMTLDQIQREERHLVATENSPNNGGFDSYGNPVPVEGRDQRTGYPGNETNYTYGYGAEGTDDPHASEGERLLAMRHEEDATREAPLVSMCKALGELYRQLPLLAERDVRVVGGGGSNPTQDGTGTARAFLDAICEWEHSVSSLAAMLELLGAISGSGEAGKQDAFSRLQTPPPGSAVAWDHFLSAVSGYNRRFAYGDDDENDDPRFVKNKNGGHNDPRGFRDGTTHLGSGSHSRQTAVLDREMPEDDVTGMIAYLDVLTCVLSDGAGGGDGRGHDSRRGTDALFQSRVAWLEQRSGCDLLDQLLRLHANPVPATLKAQLLRCVHAIAVTDAGSANEVWGLLEQQAVLQSNDHPGGEEVAQRRGEGIRSAASFGDAAFGNPPSYDANPGHAYNSNTSVPHPGAYHPYGTQSDFSAGRGGNSGRYGAASGRYGAASGGYGAASAARQRMSHDLRQTEFDNQTLQLKSQLLVPGADLSYEFQNAEARSGSYPHARAYVALVNDLLVTCATSGTGPARRAGRDSLVAFRFIRDKVFGDLKRRRHKSQEERWWMARDALTHFSIQLGIWVDAVGRGQESANPDFDGATNQSGNDTRGFGVGGVARNAPEGTHENQNSPTSAPGHELVMDFLSNGPTFRGVLAVLSVGAERLAAERSAPHGEALEATVRCALDLLNQVFEVDQQTLTDAKAQASRIGGAKAAQALSLEPLHVTLLRDPTICGCVLGYARYRFDAKVSLVSVQVLAHMSRRKPDLLHFLSDGCVANIVNGAASCLESAANVQNDSGFGLDDSSDRETTNAYPHSVTAGGGTGNAVTSAGAAVLELILDSLPQPAPNVAHVLLGFDHRKTVETCRLNPFGDKFNCLSVLLELLETTPPSVVSRDYQQPSVAPPEAAARVLFELVSDPRTAPAALECVCDWPPGAPGGQQRLALLCADALAATPPNDPQKRPAAAHHRAWVLRIAAAALDYVSPDPSSQFPIETLEDLPPLAAAIARAALSRESFESVPNEMSSSSRDSFSVVERPRLAALELLATTPAPALPPLAAAAAALDGIAMSEACQRARQSLGVDRMFTDRRPTQSGGIFEITSRGDAVVSVLALGEKLLHASAAWVDGVDGGQSMSNPSVSTAPFGSVSNQSMKNADRSSLKLAVQSAVRQARAFNASLESHAAHLHLVSAWSDLVGLVAVRCLPRGGSLGNDYGVTNAGYVLDGQNTKTEPSSEVLFALAEGVLAALASTPTLLGGQSQDSRDGGGETWYRVNDGALARLASTLLRCLRDGGDVPVGVGRRSQLDEDENSLDSKKLSADLDAAIGGGNPGVGITDVARVFETDWHRFVNSNQTPLPPSMCKALLKGLLSALRRGGDTAVSKSGGLGLEKDARAETYAALLSFLQYAKPPRAFGQFPLSVLRIGVGDFVGTGGGGRGDANGNNGVGRPAGDVAGGATVTPPEVHQARLAAENAALAQDALEQSVGSLLRRDAVFLAERLGADIVDSSVDDATRAVALAVVEALLTSLAQSGSNSMTGTYAKAAPTSMLGSNNAASNQDSFYKQHPARAPGGVGSAFANAKNDPAPVTAFSRAAFNTQTPGRGVGVEGNFAGASVGVSPSPATDPATASLVRALAHVGVVKHCLATVERASLSDVILPTNAAANRLASIRAALGVLLRLAQLPGGGAFALCESGAMHALTACAAIDAYAHDSPGDAAASVAGTAARTAHSSSEAASFGAHKNNGLRIGHGDDYSWGDDFAMDEDSDLGPGYGNDGRYHGNAPTFQMDPSLAASIAGASPVAPPPTPRQRHHALLVPVLRLAGVLVNANAQHLAVRSAGVAFVRQHTAVIHRVLADRSRGAHLCDLSELEAAVVVVARLAVASFNGNGNGGGGGGGGGNGDGDGFSMRNAGGESNGSAGAALSSASEFLPALDALTVALVGGDCKYDRFIACASHDGAPIRGTSHGKVSAAVATQAAGSRAVAVGGLSNAAAAAVAARMERSLRSVRATLVASQLSLAERGLAHFMAVELEGGEDFSPAPKPTLASFARLALRCAEEMREELSSRRSLLTALAADGGVGAAAAAQNDARGGGQNSCSAEAAAASFASGHAGAFSWSLESGRGNGGHHDRGSLLSGNSVSANARDKTSGASLAAAAVGARERGVRVLAVTVEACVELVLGKILGSTVGSTVPNQTYSPSEIQRLCKALFPAVQLLGEIDAKECAVESHGSGVVHDTVGFCGGVCVDAGRLRSLVRRARDALLAATPASETAQPSLLFGARGNASASFEKRQFGVPEFNTNEFR